MWIFYVLGAIALVWLVLVVPTLRCIVFNLFSTIFNALVDIVKHLHCRSWNNPTKENGKMICYSGLFGQGKTLSLVHYVLQKYKKYNNKKFRFTFKGGLQKIQCKILSNIDLQGVDYVPFKNLKQLVDITHNIEIADVENNTYTLLFVVFDELQNCLYCRSYKTNLSPDVLMVLTQIRKLHIHTLAYTSTRFMQTDATVRQDTSYVVECYKIWRFAYNKWYDAWEYENSFDVKQLKPVKNICWLVRNKDFNAYDTFALTEVISKDVETGNVIPLNERNLENENVKVKVVNKKG